MKPRLFAFASAVSLLICITSALLWLQTSWRDIVFNSESNARHGLAGEHRSLNLAIYRGRFSSTSQWYIDTPIDPADWPADGVTRSAHGWSMPRDQFNVSFPWFYWGTIERTGLISRRVDIPLWSICAATAVLPLAYLRRWLRKNARVGCCAKCGYDLRATPDRCPECGTVALHARFLPLR